MSLSRRSMSSIDRTRERSVHSKWERERERGKCQSSSRRRHCHAVRFVNGEMATPCIVANLDIYPTQIFYSKNIDDLSNETSCNECLELGRI